MELSTILTSLLSFLAGLWASTFLQDRDVRRRHLGVTRALLAEVKRVRAELGPLSEAYIPVSVLGAKPTLPTLSPWLDTALVDLASTDPEAIAHFMDLERYLANLRVFVSLSERAGDELARRKGEQELVAKTADGATLDNFGEAMLAEFAAKKAVEQAESGIEKAQFAQTVSYRHAVTALALLETRLGSLESHLAGGWWTHLPWSGQK